MLSNRYLPHCCWSAKNSTITKPIKILAKIVSAVVMLSLKRDTRSMTYAGVDIKKSRMLCAREIKATLKRKNNVGLIFSRRTSLQIRQFISSKWSMDVPYHL